MASAVTSDVEEVRIEEKEPRSLWQRCQPFFVYSFILVCIVGAIIFLIITLTTNWYLKYIFVGQEYTDNGICAISCLNGELHHKKCKCVCNEGYSGDLCEIGPTTLSPSLSTPCQLDCGQNGDLDTSTCTCSCDPGYVGATCSDPDPSGRTPLPINPDDCTIDCGANGRRHRRRCECVCDEGYSGFNCTNNDIALCVQDTYCENGGTCDLLPGLESSMPSCLCTYGFKGQRCELIDRCPGLDCGAHGHLALDECRCICNGRYSGPMCSYQKDNHTEPCSTMYKDYCLNGGTCKQFRGIKKPTCNCLLNFGGDRCKYLRPQHVISIKENSMKVIITLTIIFISLLLVLLLVVFIYIKNKNYREAERRKRIKTQRSLLRPVNYNSHLASPGLSGQQARVIQGQADEMEMVPRRPSAPSAMMRLESDGSLQQTSSQRSRSVDVRYTSVPTTQANPMVVRTMHNGHARKISQASLQSNRSTSSHRSNGSSPGSASGKRRRLLGYEAVPVMEPSDAIEEYRGDAAACEDANIMMLRRDEACSDDDSECFGDDTVDVPNPQVCAIETHLARPSDGYDGAATETDLTADVVNANGHISADPYTLDATAMHSGSHLGAHPHLQASPPPQEVNLRENPLHGANSFKAQTHRPTNELLGIDGYYGSQFEDEIDRNSPPHAV